MKTVAAKFVWLAMLFALTASPLRAQDDEAGARSKVLALEHAWNQAEAFHDLKALDALFDSRLVYVDSDGRLMTKAEFLLQAKTAHLQQVITQSMTVQVFGETAIATATYLARELRDGKAIQNRGRFVDTWVHRNQTWVCIAAQATPILR